MTFSKHFYTQVARQGLPVWKGLSTISAIILWKLKTIMLKAVYNICMHKFSAVGQITTLERLGTTNPWYDPKEGSFIALYIILLLLLCLTSLPLFLLFYLYQILQWASCLSPSMKPLVIPLSPHLSVCVCPHHLSVCHLRCWFPDRPQGCHGIAVVMEPVSEETSVTILKFWLYFSKLIQVISFSLAESVPIF